jgi:hypothetical protein
MAASKSTKAGRAERAGGKAAGSGSGKARKAVPTVAARAKRAAGGTRVKTAARVSATEPKRLQRDAHKTELRAEPEEEMFFEVRQARPAPVEAPPAPRGNPPPLPTPIVTFTI